MEPPDQKCRHFLVALTLSLGGLLALGRFLTPSLKRRRVLVRSHRAELPGRGALVYREARVALLNQGGRISALSLVCPHLGCTVNVTTTELVCPCHGSRFDREGRVLKGPADRDLTRYRVEEHDGVIEVLV